MNFIIMLFLIINILLKKYLYHVSTRIHESWIDQNYQTNQYKSTKTFKLTNFYYTKSKSTQINKVITKFNKYRPKYY